MTLQFDLQSLQLHKIPKVIAIHKIIFKNIKYIKLLLLLLLFYIATRKSAANSCLIFGELLCLFGSCFLTYNISARCSLQPPPVPNSYDFVIP